MSPEPSRPPSAAEARAAEEARRAGARQELEAWFVERDGTRRPGIRDIWAETIVTLVLAGSALLAVVAPEEFVGVYFSLSCLAFLVGTGLFAVAMVVAARRSRAETIGVGGLFFMTGSAPQWARRRLLGLLAAQVVVAVAAASVRPFTPLAFGTLAPMLGLGCCGLWTARHGWFPPRDRGPAGRAA